MNLNINEQLMQDTKDANLCIFIANLATWLRTNAGKLHKPLEQRNFHDDRYWSYNSIEGFVKYFGFWSTRQIRVIIQHGIDEGLIITSNFNKKRFDNTLWYTLTDKGLNYYPQLRELTLNSLVKNDKRLVKNDNAIPELLTTCSNNTITTTSSTSKVNELLQKLIQVYREEFPDNPQPHKSLISTSLDKALRGLIKRWPEADPTRKPITVEGFRRYMQGLKELCPKFALGEYLTKDGNKKKNGLETFCRWNTFVKFLENQYT